MRRIFIILVALTLSVYSCGQSFFTTDPSTGGSTTNPPSGEGIIADTASRRKPEPPDTIQSFSVDVGGTDEPFSSLLTGIKSYWTLEEAAGNAVDSVGTSDLPVYGTVTRQQTGKLDYCYSFTTDGYLGNIDTYYELSPISLSAWVKTSAAGDGGYEVMSNFSTGGTNRGYELLMWNSGGVGTIRMYVRGGWGTSQSVSTTAINDNAWHHIVGIWDGDTTKIYVDGDLEDSDYSANGPEYIADNRFSIGRRSNGQYYWEGSIDEPSVWNKELTQGEIDSLFTNEVQYPFSAQGSGGDSLRMQCIDLDERGDSVRVLAKLSGYSTSRTDGTLLFAFNMADSADYNDTTFAHSLTPQDTTWYITAWIGLDDDWTITPNKDTVLIDSSDIAPIPPDYPGIWDTIEYWDFENHTGLPKEYTYSLWMADGWNGQDNWRASDNRWPSGWQGVCVDSIIVDPVSGSKVLQINNKDTIIQGYDCQGSNTGGEKFYPAYSKSHDELYISFNIRVKPDMPWSKGGKWGPGPAGGTAFPHGQGPSVPGYGQGFTAQLTWHWDANAPQGDLAGVLYWYLYYQDMGGTYGDTKTWSQFNPVGDGTLDYNEDGMYVVDNSGAWVNYTTRVVVNSFTGSTPNYDGILEGYVNGYLVGQYTGLYLITYPDEELSLDRFNFSHFWGGGGPCLREEWALFDDIYVFTYDESVDVPRGNEASPAGRILNLPNWPKPTTEQ